MAKTMDDLAREKAGASQNDGGKDKSQQPKDPVKELEDLISSVENIEKREFLQAKLRQLRSDADLRARESDARARQFNENDKGGREKTVEEDKWTVLAGKPVRDPEGEYTFSQAIKVAAIEAGKDTKTDTGILGVLKFMKDEGMMGNGGNKEGDPITAQLIQKAIDHTYGDNAGKSPEMETLRAELKDLREQVKQASDPLAAAKKVREMYEGFAEAGLITKGNEGRPLEEIKEENRHKEEMEKQKADRDYKDKQIDVLSKIPKSIGQGLAGRIQESEEPIHRTSNKQNPKMEYLKCTGEIEQDDGETVICGFDIPIPPGAAKQITCPKCGTVYTNKG